MRDNDNTRSAQKNKRLTGTGTTRPPFDCATYDFRLFVSGMTPNSLRAIENIRAFCKEHLAGRYHLEIIDIYQQPLCAKEYQIVAVPTLVKQTPPPARRFIGDLSHTDRLLSGLGVSCSR
ncbi:hypothetical protein GMLC_34910 [Geomonas limicola]|uniref:KaiB domain-containing protein n=1 Tax=Geomonas limicola TaxID=2740186 RepID=A0A6V8NBA5_9BACT|nr:circadian clock KaiB family protein [Geomonas limicola]GFO69912.1 hypothetical protein GMLC_34910 [Geomonas limicola]